MYQLSEASFLIGSLCVAALLFSASGLLFVCLAYCFVNQSAVMSRKQLGLGSRACVGCMNRKIEFSKHPTLASNRQGSIQVKFRVKVEATVKKPVDTSKEIRGKVGQKIIEKAKTGVVGNLKVSASPKDLQIAGRSDSLATDTTQNLAPSPATAHPYNTLPQPPPPPPPTRFRMLCKTLPHCPEAHMPATPCRASPSPRNSPPLGQILTRPTRTTL